MYKILLRLVMLMSFFCMSVVNSNAVEENMDLEANQISTMTEQNDHMVNRVAVRNKLSGGIGYYYGGTGLNYELQIMERIGLTTGVGTRALALTGLPSEAQMGWMIGARYYFNNPGDHFRWRIGVGVAPSFISIFTDEYGSVLDSEIIMGAAYGLGFEWRINKHLSIDVDGLGATPFKNESTYVYNGDICKNDITGTAFFSAGLTYHIKPHDFDNHKYPILNQMQSKWSVEESSSFVIISNENSDSGSGLSTALFYGLLNNLQVGFEYVFFNSTINEYIARSWSDEFDEWRYGYDNVKTVTNLMNIAARGYLPASHCFNWTLDLGMGVGVSLIDYEKEMFSYYSSNPKLVRIKRTDVGFVAKGLVGFEWFWAESLALKMNLGYLYGPIYQGTENYNDDGIYDFSIDMSGITGNVGFCFNF